jgi:hypothetical protein
MTFVTISTSDAYQTSSDTTMQTVLVFLFFRRNELMRRHICILYSSDCYIALDVPKIIFTVFFNPYLVAFEGAILKAVLVCFCSSLLFFLLLLCLQHGFRFPWLGDAQLSLFRWICTSMDYVEYRCRPLSANYIMTSSSAPTASKPAEAEQNRRVRQLAPFWQGWRCFQGLKKPV